MVYLWFNIELWWYFVFAARKKISKKLPVTDLNIFVIVIDNVNFGYCSMMS